MIFKTYYGFTKRVKNTYEVFLGGLYSVSRLGREASGVFVCTRFIFQTEFPANIINIPFQNLVKLFKHNLNVFFGEKCLHASS